MNPPVWGERNRRHEPGHQSVPGRRLFWTVRLPDDSVQVNPERGARSTRPARSRSKTTAPSATRSTGCPACLPPCHSRCTGRVSGSASTSRIRSPASVANSSGAARKRPGPRSSATTRSSQIRWRRHRVISRHSARNGTASSSRGRSQGSKFDVRETARWASSQPGRLCDGRRPRSSARARTSSRSPRRS